MEIMVLGPGCANCFKMEALAKTAVKELGIKAKIEKITDIHRSPSTASYPRRVLS